MQDTTTVPAVAMALRAASSRLRTHIDLVLLQTVALSALESCPQFLRPALHISMLMGYIATRRQAVPKAHRRRVIDRAVCSTQPARSAKKSPSKSAGSPQKGKRNAVKPEREKTAQSNTTQAPRKKRNNPKGGASWRRETPGTAPSHAETDARGREWKEERKDGTESADQRPN